MASRPSQRGRGGRSGVVAAGVRQQRLGVDGAAAVVVGECQWRARDGSGVVGFLAAVMTAVRQRRH